MVIDKRQSIYYSRIVILSFRHKGLKELFETGQSRRVAPMLQSRAIRRLDRIDAARQLTEVNLPGFDFHALRGKPARYTVYVNGPWTITFGWDGENAIEVDLEQYH